MLRPRVRKGQPAPWLPWKGGRENIYVHLISPFIWKAEYEEKEEEKETKGIHLFPALSRKEVLETALLPRNTELVPEVYRALC